MKMRWFRGKLPLLSMLLTSLVLQRSAGASRPIANVCSEYRRRTSSSCMPRQPTVNFTVGRAVSKNDEGKDDMHHTIVGKALKFLKGAIIGFSLCGILIRLDPVSSALIIL